MRSFLGHVDSPPVLDSDKPHCITSFFFWFCFDIFTSTSAYRTFCGTAPLLSREWGYAHNSDLEYILAVELWSQRGDLSSAKPWGALRGRAISQFCYLLRYAAAAPRRCGSWLQHARSSLCPAYCM